MLPENLTPLMSMLLQNLTHVAGDAGFMAISRGPSADLAPSLSRARREVLPPFIAATSVSPVCDAILPSSAFVIDHRIVAAIPSLHRRRGSKLHAGSKRRTPGPPKQRFLTMRQFSSL